MKKIRESNYELLRIVAMFFIVAWHVIIHGHLLNNTTGNLNLVMHALELFFIVHVSVFMLLTGYFQSKSKFKLNRLITLILEIWFYNFLINTVLSLTGIVKYTKAEYLSQIMFYNFSSYWYIQCYIIVYLLSPYLNKFIDSCSKKEFKRIIIIMLCCFSIIPSVTFNFSYNAHGSTSEQYILLYFIGAYIRKYELNQNFLKSWNKNKKRLLYIGIYILAWMTNFGLYYFSKILLPTKNSIIEFISSFLQSTKFYYSRPLVIIQSLAIFLLFGTFHFKNKIVNTISRLTIGIYFIHESTYIRSNLYTWLGIDGHGMLYGKRIIIKLFLASVIIFLVCFFIDFLREKIFEFLSKQKMIRKINNQLENIIEKRIKKETELKS